MGASLALAGDGGDAEGRRRWRRWGPGSGLGAGLGDDGPDCAPHRRFLQQQQGRPPPNKDAYPGLDKSSSPGRVSM